MDTRSSREDMHVDVEISGGLNRIKITPGELRFSGQSGQGRLEVKIKHYDKEADQIKRENKEREERERQEVLKKIQDLELELQETRRQRREKMKEITSSFLSAIDEALRSELNDDFEDEDKYLTHLNEECRKGKREAESMKKQVSQQEALITQIVERYRKKLEQKLKEKRQRQLTIVLLPKTRKATPVYIDKQRLKEVATKLRRDFNVNLQGLDSNMDFILEFDKYQKQGVLRQMPRIQDTLAELIPPENRDDIDWKMIDASTRIDDEDLRLGQSLPQCLNTLLDEFVRRDANGGDYEMNDEDRNYVSQCIVVGATVGRRIAGPIGIVPGAVVGGVVGVMKGAKVWVFGENSPV